MAAFSYKRSLTIDHTQCGNSDSSDFPVLVKISSAAFKTAANGGHIQNTVTQSGGNAVTMPADMRVTADSGGAITIPWEVESYDPVNGVLWVWIKVATLSHTADTVIYMFYGDAMTTTQQNTGSYSPAAVWTNGFAGVWHLPGSTLSAKDSTSNANNGAINSAIATTGQVDGAAGFNGSAYIDVPANPSLNATAGVTVELWVNPTTVGGTYQALISKANYNYAILLGADVASWFYLRMNGNVGLIGGTGSVVANAWNHIAYTADGTRLIVYLNGSQVLIATNGNLPPVDSQDVFIGSEAGGAYPVSGVIDEARVSSTARGPDWILAEYNNQSSPSTFIAVGAESGAVSGGAGIKHKVTNQ